VSKLSLSLAAACVLMAASASSYGYNLDWPSPPSPDWNSLERALEGHGYNVTRVLGDGGFGRAYKCKDRSGAEKVLKVALSQSDHSEMMEEYRTMNELRHPNLPHVYYGSKIPEFQSSVPSAFTKAFLRGVLEACFKDGGMMSRLGQMCTHEKYCPTRENR